MAEQIHQSKSGLEQDSMCADTEHEFKQERGPVPLKIGEPLDVSIAHLAAKVALQGFIENEELGGARF